MLNLKAGQAGAAAVLLCGLISVLNARYGFAQAIVEPSHDVRLPIEHFEDGSVKTLLTAELATIPPKGEIQAEKVRVEFYDEKGNIVSVMTADKCNFNRVNGMITSDTDVRLENGDDVVTGTGMECNVGERTVKILSNVKVVLGKSHVLQNKGKTQ
jgi:hypothetical protein